jgi:hypothetical protein
MGMRQVVVVEKIAVQLAFGNPSCLSNFGGCFSRSIFLLEPSWVSHVDPTGREVVSK